jgi:hypothetical protein
MYSFLNSIRKGFERKREIVFGLLTFFLFIFCPLALATDVTTNITTPTTWTTVGNPYIIKANITIIWSLWEEIRYK